MRHSYTIAITFPLVYFLTAALMPAPALAGITGIFTKAAAAEIAPIILSAALGILAILFGALYRKVARTIRETGEFLEAVGSAVEDGRITREELGTIIREGRGMLGGWS